MASREHGTATRSLPLEPIARSTGISDTPLMRARSARFFGRRSARIGIFLGVWAAGWLSLPACSGARFKSGEGASAGRAISAGGSAGSRAEGGASGEPGDAGTGGSAGGAGRAGGGAAGSGGASGSASSGTAGLAAMAGAGAVGGSASCSCNAGEYCRAERCYPCTDLSKLDFAPPEPIDDTAGLRFPRSGPSDVSLFFTRTDSPASGLWYVPELGASAPLALGGQDAPARSGLLFVGPAGMLGYDVLFDEVGANGRSIRAASFESSALANTAAARAPLAGGYFDDYSVAYASTPGRAYWMSTRDGAPALYTGLLGSDTFTLVELTIPATGTAGTSCPRQGDDATPWVTPDGRLLLFRAVPLDGDCTPVDGDASDLYAALLDSATGLPRANAIVALNGVNTTGDASVESDPSFSADLCTLYLASDGGGAEGHQFRLFRALRR